MTFSALPLAALTREATGKTDLEAWLYGSTEGVACDLPRDVHMTNGLGGGVVKPMACRKDARETIAGWNA